MAAKQAEGGTSVRDREGVSSDVVHTSAKAQRPFCRDVENGVLSFTFQDQNRHLRRLLIVSIWGVETGACKTDGHGGQR